MKPIIYGLIIMENKARLTKRVMISAMHELRSEKLSSEENERIFGKCVNLHGHDYWIEVTVEGIIDPDSGLICDRDYFEDQLQKYFVDKFDKTNLNDHFPNTTGEILVEEFFKLLKDKLRPLNIVGVRLQETPKNFFTKGISAVLNF